MAARDNLHAGGGARTPADVCSLLIELGRLVKAWRFYPADHPARKELVDRAWRAWSSELARGGGLEIELRQGAFRLVGSKDPIGRGALDDLAREFVHRAVRRVRFDADLDAEGFGALLEVLAADADELAAAGGVERALYARVQRGIALNQVDYGAALERDPDAGAAPPEGDAVEGEPDETTGVDPLAMLAGLLGGSGSGETDADAAPPESESHEWRTGDLVVLLRELDECRDDARYVQVLPRVVAEAAALADEGDVDEGYRAILVLASHAADAERSERQRGLASEGLVQMASAGRLDDLIQRACQPGATASVRASQVLLQLGGHSVPRLLDALRGEGDPDRRGRMSGILITMGEKAAGHLIEAIGGRDPERARVAARLAGEIQNPASVPALRELLRREGVPGDVRREAAKALARVGSQAAVSALIDALSSAQPDVPAAAAFCLGATGNQRALEALVATLRRAQRSGDVELARETIRALGRLGRAEAAPELAGILRQRALFGRRRLRELQLAAAAALGRVPGEAAQRALDRAARRGDTQVRQAARAALERREGRRAAP